MLLYLWDSPGKNTGLGCHALLQGTFPTQGSDPHLLCLKQVLYMLELSHWVWFYLLSRVQLLRPHGRSPPGSSAHGILQARILEWVAISSSRDLPDPGIACRSPALQADDSLTELWGNCHILEQFYFWVYTQKTEKYSFEEMIIHLCSQKYSQYPKAGSNSSVHG